MMWRHLLVLVWIVILTGPMLSAQDDTSGVVEPGAGSADLLDQIESDADNEISLFSKLGKWLHLGGSPASEGKKAYGRGDYDLALQKFLEARLDNPESQALQLNIGSAHYKKKKYDNAIEAYKKALNGDDADLSAAAYYNLGNAHFRKGEFAVQSRQGQDQQGIQEYRSAMANYKKALDIDPDNGNAKRNIEVVQARIKELLERKEQEGQQQQNQDSPPPPKPSEKAKEALARAMQLVKQRKYEEAKQVLETIIQEDETAISFQSHVQRIDDIMKILAGEDPRPAQPQDPRSRQQGLGVI